MGRAFFDSVAAYIERHHLFGEGARVLVGVSGGADSMVCLFVLDELGYDVRACHVNYGLREGADEDEALVERWCTEGDRAIPLSVVHLDPETRASAYGESIQEAARVLRYEAFAARAASIGADAVAVGHHQDDQAETLLLNLVRGAGPEGLAGMPPSRPLSDEPGVPLVRPLLDVSRTEIEAVAEREAIPWRDDPTNRDPTYDRAFIRTEVVPLLQERFSNASASIAQAATLMQEYVETTLTPVLHERFDRCYVDRDVGGALLLDPLREMPSVWRRRLVLAALERAFSEAPHTAAVAEEVEGLIDAQVGRRVEIGAGTVWRDRDLLRFVPAAPDAESAFTPRPIPWGEDVPLPNGVLRIDPVGTPPDDLAAGTPNVVYADADRLTDPLSVRQWREGDRFRPLGLDGTKLVSDLLTDAKVSPHERDDVYVVSTDEHLAWVVGYRLDHRVRVRPDTDHVARLTWRPREKASDDCISA